MNGMLKIPFFALIISPKLSLFLISSESDMERKELGSNYGKSNMRVTSRVKEFQVKEGKTIRNDEIHVRLTLQYYDLGGR